MSSIKVKALINLVEKYTGKKVSLKEAIAQDTYFETFSGAVQFARTAVESKGYEINSDSWFSEINVGNGRPKEGKTNTFNVQLTKNGKESRKLLHIQVYNRGNNISKPYELNFYIS